MQNYCYYLPTYSGIIGSVSPFELGGIPGNIHAIASYATASMILLYYIYSHGVRNYHDKTQSIQVRVGCKLVSFGCKLLMLVLLVSREMWYALHGLGFTRWFLIDHIHMYGLPSTH